MPKNIKKHKIFIIEEFFGCRIYNTKSQKEYLFNKKVTATIKDCLNNPRRIQLLNGIKELCRKDLVSSDMTLIKSKNNLGLSSPLKISLNITKECNLRCKHCLSSADYADSNELTKKQLFDLFDQMLEIGSFFITIGGGEPLIRKDIFDIISYARDHYISVSIVTNSLLINKETALRLNSLNLNTITISIDGFEKNHDYIRGKGNFKKAITKIKLLRKYIKTARLAIRVTVNSRNVNECKSLIKLAEDLSLDLIRLTPVLPLGRALENQNLLLSQDQFIKFVKNCREKKTKIKVIIPNAKENESFLIKQGEFGCHCGKEACWITQVGDFYPCLFFGEDYVTGNIKDSHLGSLWIKAKDKVNLCGNRTCNNCSNYINCRGGCRARALWQYKDINAIDPYCLLGKKQHKLNL
jgi:radical SAM protein with 4Fe4S-binding SPASM domain